MVTYIRLPACPAHPGLWAVGRTARHSLRDRTIWCEPAIDACRIKTLSSSMSNCERQLLFGEPVSSIQVLRSSVLQYSKLIFKWPALHPSMLTLPRVRKRRSTQYQTRSGYDNGFGLRKKTWNNHEDRRFRIDHQRTRRQVDDDQRVKNCLQPDFV